MLVSMHMKFDKLPAYNQYFAERLVSIFHVLFAFSLDKLPAYYKKLFQAGKQVSISRDFPFLFIFFSFLENSMESVKLPAYCNQLSSLEENPRCFIQICQTSRLLQDAYATGNASH